MARFFLFDLKRIFGSGRTVLLCIVLPLAVLLLFTTMVAPLLVTQTRVAATAFAVYNEDGTKVTRQFIDFVANAKSFQGIVSVFTVNSLEKGLRLVKNHEASGLLHIPAGFYDAMSGGRDVTMDVYGGDTNVLECSLVLTVLETALQEAGGAQNALGALHADVIRLGGSEESADGLYDAMMTCGMGAITNRQAVLGPGGFVSPTSGYLPAEFCLSAMLTWFLALALLPLAGFSAGDFSMSVLQRGMKTRSMRLRFLAARLLSGAVFLVAVMAIVFPAGAVSSGFTRFFNGNTLALCGAIFFMALCFSAIALAVSAWMPNRDAALWLAFWLIVVLSLFGGTAAPESVLPGWARAAGQWSPIRSAMRLLAGGIFNFDGAAFVTDLLKTGLWGLLGCVLAAVGFTRKAAV
jgi:hypothetical protein